MNTAVEQVDRTEIDGRVRAALADVMDIDSYGWNERGSLLVRGHLVAPAQPLYGRIRERLEAFGFTAFLRQRDNFDEVLAVPGVAERRAQRRLLPAVLFAITFLTVLATGALYEQADPFRHPAQLLAGLPFAATLMGILFAHEMGHYVVGRLRHAPVSLPYFIPMPPFISFTGTMGAVIVQREPMQDRKTVLEIGIAGPLAGLALAVPLLLYGLSHSHVGAPLSGSGGYVQEGNSLLYIFAKWLVFGRYLPSNGEDVQLNSVAWGAWIGLLVTMINLLPAGQLDGGHIAYALLGDKARYLAYAVIGVCFLMGALGTITWVVWGLMALAIGPRHPAPLDDISRLDTRHIALAVFGLLVFVLLITPSPLNIVGG